MQIEQPPIARPGSPRSGPWGPDHSSNFGIPLPSDGDQTNNCGELFAQVQVLETDSRSHLLFLLADTSRVSLMADTYFCAAGLRVRGARGEGRGVSD